MRANKIKRRKMQNLILKVLITIAFVVLLGVVIGLIVYLYLLEQCGII